MLQKQKQSKLKMGIRHKITLLVSSTVLGVVIIGISLGYFLGFNLLTDVIGENNKKIAAILATNIAERIDEEIKQINIYITDPAYKNMIAESNSAYEPMNTATIQEYLLNLDEEWVGAGDDSPLVRKYLENAVSVELHELLEQEENIAEMFITDKFGGLVACSGRTSDFYQADEEWWQRSYNDGKGKNWIGDMEFDESANVWALPFSTPIMAEDGEVIGICKAVVAVGRFFKPIERFKIGKTGHADLVDKDSYLVFHHRAEPLSENLLRDEGFKNLLKSERKWITTVDRRTGKRALLTFAEIKHPILLERGISWRVIIDQSAEEIFTPLNTLMLQLLLVTSILLMLLVPIGFISGGIFIRPIRKLHEATENIARGNLDYRIDVKTGDEIEELSDSFNEMAAELKNTTTSIHNLNNEITERKKLEDELREKENWIRSVVDAALTGIVIIDADTSKVVDVNSAAAEMIDLPKEKIIGRLCHRFICPKDIGKCPIRDFGESVDSSERILLKSDGEEIPILKTVTSINAKGRKYLIECFVDITERKRMEEELWKATEEAKAANSAKSGFLANMSHELRTPLNAIIGFSEVLRDEGFGPLNDKQKEYITDILESGRHQLALVNDILDLSKVEAGKMELKSTNLDIRAVVKNALSLIKESAMKHKIEISDTEDEIDALYADEKRIKQVMYNLLSNAVKFTPDGGRIMIKAKRDKQEAIISVHDTGIGIEEKDKDKVFKMFDQIDSPYVRKHKGTGLGLALSKRIVELHSGKIWFESEGRNKGTTFYFTLPLKR